jgi:hypothetical protein
MSHNPHPHYLHSIHQPHQRTLITTHFPSFPSPLTPARIARLRGRGCPPPHRQASHLHRRSQNLPPLSVFLFALPSRTLRPFVSARRAVSVPGSFVSRQLSICSLPLHTGRVAPSLRPSAPTYLTDNAPLICFMSHTAAPPPQHPRRRTGASGMDGASVYISATGKQDPGWSRIVCVGSMTEHSSRAATMRSLLYAGSGMGGMGVCAKGVGDEVQAVR